MQALLKLSVVALGLSACATTPMTKAVLEDQAAYTERVHIEAVPFVQQTHNHCGPATLAMALGWAGNPVPVEELASQVYTPGKEGSLQADMISASRRRGMMAMQIYGMPSLLRELEAKHPVIVLENLAFTWYPWWHYSVALGYDLKSQDLLLHSGSHQDWRLDLKKFERNWKYAQYWALVVLPAGELSVSASEQEHSAAAAGLEQVGFLEKAELSYQAILKRWPTSLGALIGLGNITYARREFTRAVEFLSQAVKFHPANPAAWHNLALAQVADYKKRDAKKSAVKALELAPADSVASYRESLQNLIPKIL